MIRLFFLMTVRRIWKDKPRLVLLLLLLTLTTTICVSVAATKRLSIASMERLSGITENSDIIVRATTTNAKSDFSWVRNILPSGMAATEQKREDGVRELHLQPPKEIDAEAFGQSLRFRLPYLEAAYEVMTPGFVEQEATEITASFRKNIGVLVLLTAGISLFILFAAAQLSATQMQQEFAIQRTLGFSRLGIFWSFLIEGGVLGCIGAALGVSIGRPVNTLFLSGILKTISAQYSGGLQVAPEPLASELVTGALLTIGITLLGYMLPMLHIMRRNITELLREDASANPLLASRWPYFVIASLVTAGASFILRDMLTGSVLILVAATSLSLFALCLLDSVPQLFTGGVSALVAKQLHKDLRTPKILPLTASSVALTLLIGMHVFVSGFETMLMQWADRILAADIFIAAAPLKGLPQPAIDSLKTDPKVSSVFTNFFVQERVGGHRAVLSGVPFESSLTNHLYPILAGNLDREALEKGEAVLVSEPASRKLGLKAGEALSLFGKKFRISGIYQDFARDAATIVLEQSVLRTHTHIDRVDSVSVMLKDASSADEIVKGLQADGLDAKKKGTLLRDIQTIFSETFEVTRILELILVIICGIGALLNFLQQLWHERQTIHALQIIGLTRSDLLKIFTTVAIGMSAAAMVGGILFGEMLGWYLCAVISPQTFGWTIAPQFNFTQPILPTAVLTASLMLAAISAVLIKVSPQYARMYD